MVLGVWPPSSDQFLLLRALWVGWSDDPVGAATLSTPHDAAYKLRQALRPLERLLVSSAELRAFQEKHGHSLLHAENVRRRWGGLAERRKLQVLRAVEAAELTVAEICAELGCRREHVQAARLLLGKVGT